MDLSTFCRTDENIALSTLCQPFKLTAKNFGQLFATTVKIIVILTSLPTFCLHGRKFLPFALLGIACFLHTFFLLSKRSNFVKTIATRIFMKTIFVENLTQNIFGNL